MIAGAALLAFVVVVMAIAIRYQLRAEANRRTREWYAACSEFRQHSAPNVLRFPSREDLRSSLPKAT